jgi:putative flippase GtrA
MRLGHVFLRFSSASLVTGITDQVLFILALKIGVSVAGGIVAARLLASILNLYLNRRYVFWSRAALVRTMARYYLCMAFSGSIAYVLIIAARDRLHWPIVPAKMAVEALLFLLSFVLGRYVVFRQRHA